MPTYPPPYVMHPLTYRGFIAKLFRVVPLVSVNDDFISRFLKYITDHMCLIQSIIGRF